MFKFIIFVLTSYIWFYFPKSLTAEAMKQFSCEIIAQNNKAESFAYDSVFSIPHPQLKCTGVGRVVLEADGNLKKVKSISISNNDMIHFNIDTLKKYPDIKALNIISTSLKWLDASKKNLRLTSVRQISLKYNALLEVPTKALKSFPNLKILDISLNSISHVWWYEFQHNPRLSYLQMGYNPFTWFEDWWMDSLNLTGLDIPHSVLTKLPRRIANQSQLLYADFSNNLITRIPANSFSNCHSLMSLQLAGNRIKVIEDDAFKGASQLNSIDLSDNLLHTLTREMFNGVETHDLTVELYENPFICNCSMRKFSDWAHDLTYSKYAAEFRYKCDQPARNHGKKGNSISPRDFTCKSTDVEWEDCHSTLPTPTETPTAGPAPSFQRPRICPTKCICYDEDQNIYYPAPGQQENKKYAAWIHEYGVSYPRVDCVDTNFREIPVNIPINVSMILLTGNKIIKLPITSFTNFSDLQTLQLPGNNIVTITNNSNITIPNVQVLNLAFNRISVIKKEDFRSFPNIVLIALHHNFITNVPEDLFAFNRILKRLYFGANPVQSFHEDFISTLSLISLSLRNMSLQAVPKSINKLTNLTYIDLSDNLITHLANSTFSNCDKLMIVLLDNNRIERIDTNAFSGANAVFFINLSENMITSLPETVFANVNKDILSVLLYENPFFCDCKMKLFKKWIEERQNTNPAVEIRFDCSGPLRLHNRKSAELSWKNFTCSSHAIQDKASHCEIDNFPGKIALTVFLTIILISLVNLVIWKCVLKRSFKSCIHPQGVSRDREELNSSLRFPL